MKMRREGERSSRTAELMAVQRGLESARPAGGRLFCDPFAAGFVSPAWRLALFCAHIGPLRRLIERLYDHFAGPGPRASAVARTRLIDDLLSEKTASARQLVILGAGYDARAHRLRALAGCTVFEVDQPGTQQVKRARLGRFATSLVGRLIYVAVNFEHDDLVRSLLSAGYRADRGAVFLWEGVTNYLTAQAVDGTLAAIRQLASPGSSLLFTYVDRAALKMDSAAFPEAARWLQGVTARGEPWTFGLDPGEVNDYLRRRGFRLTSDLSTAEAGERYFGALGRRERGSRLYHVVTAVPVATGGKSAVSW
jgi:methyltransferase (TIGR00027 family)